MAKPYRYSSYIGKYIVPGKMVTRMVTVEADEGPNSWEERRTYWKPRTKTSENNNGDNWLAQYRTNYSRIYYVPKILCKVKGTRR